MANGSVARRNEQLSLALLAEIVSLVSTPSSLYLGKRI
jgi:hypothetical protein